jgi:hypothetical protein
MRVRSRCAAQRAPWPPGATRRSRAGWRCRRWSAQCLRGGAASAQPRASRQSAAGCVRARACAAPPEASRSILSIERGPSVVRMMSDTACVSERRAESVAACSRMSRRTRARHRRRRVPALPRCARARAFAAAMLPVCALRPMSRFTFWSAAQRRARRRAASGLALRMRTRTSAAAAAARKSAHALRTMICWPWPAMVPEARRALGVVAASAQPMGTNDGHKTLCAAARKLSPCALSALRGCARGTRRRRCECAAARGGGIAGVRRQRGRRRVRACQLSRCSGALHGRAAAGRARGGSRGPRPACRAAACRCAAS